MSNQKSTYEIITDLTYFLSQHSGNSLIEYTQPARAQPITLLDNRAAQLPYIESVLHTAVNVFSGYYLMAYNLALNVGSVDVLRTLDKLNPNRDPLLGTTGGRLGGVKLQNMANALPMYNQSSPYESKRLYTQESLADDVLRQGEFEPAETQIDKDFLKQHNENANLSVGKLLNVTVESNGSKASFPVMIQLLVSNVVPSVLVHTLSFGQNKDRSLLARWREYRAGMISFWRDLVWCQDLIEENRDLLRNDNQGIFKRMQKSKSKNMLAGILSGTPSVATASQIVVMTAETAAELEAKTKSRFSKFSDREKIFKEMYLMLVFVIDTDFERVTIYHRSIEAPTVVSVKEMQRSGKKNGPDILDVLNAYTNKKNPVI